MCFKVWCSNRISLIKQHKYWRWRGWLSILTPTDVSRSCAEVVENAPCGFSNRPVTQMQSNPQNHVILLTLLWVTCGLFLSVCLQLLSVSAPSLCYHAHLPSVLSLLLVHASPNPLADDLSSSASPKTGFLYVDIACQVVLFLLILHCGFRL